MQDSRQGGLCYPITGLDIPGRRRKDGTPAHRSMAPMKSVSGTTVVVRIEIDSQYRSPEWVRAVQSTARTRTAEGFEIPSE